MATDRSKLTIECPADDVPSKNNNNLSIERGDSATFEFKAVNPDDETEVVDLSTVTLVKFSVKTPVTQGQTNTNLIIQKNSTRPGEISIVPSSGIVYVEILPEDTVGINPGAYKYDVQLTFSDGRIFTLVNDFLEIIEEMTLEGTPAGQQYVPVLTSKGQYMKRTALQMGRVLLKDFRLSPKISAFTDEELNIFLDISLSDFNAEPTFTAFWWNDLEQRWLGVIARGVQVMALYAQGLIEQGREFNITDNGITFTPPGLGGYMQSTASAILAQYQKEKEVIKANMKPAPHYLGTFRTLNVLPSYLRLRHMRERQII